MGSGEISDMPRAPMSSTSKIAEIIEKKVDLEILLLELKEVQKRETKYVRRVVEKLQRADDKKIILMRYVDQRSWDSILKAVYGKEIDFGGKEESYERKMYRRHNAAIDSMYSISKRDRIW